MEEMHYTDLLRDHPEQKMLFQVQNPYPQYYPALILDFLWYITQENMANRALLGGTSVGGVHFIDLFFSPQIRQAIGSDWHEQVLNVIRYFISATSEYQREDDVFHEEYVRTREHLAQLPEFDEMLKNLTSRPIDRSGTPFQAGIVYMEYRINDTLAIPLELTAEGQVIQDDKPAYRLTLVPLNQQTKAGLILLNLAHNEFIHKDVHDDLLQQYLWRLTLVKTIKEGIVEDNANTEWEPQVVYQRIRNELDVEFSKLTENAIDEAIARLRAIIDRLDEDKILDKEILRDVLIHLTDNQEELTGEDPEQITISQAQEKLRKPCAFWLLNPKGDIIAANLLATWLWEQKQLNSHSFFGVNVFEIFSRNRSRIPKDKNDEFFRKKIPVLIRLIGGFGRERYESFLNYIESYLDLKNLFDEQKYIPDEEWNTRRLWEYPLTIVPPLGTKGIEFLEFQVTIYRLHPGNEFFCIYEPHPRSSITQTTVNRKFNDAMAIVNAGMIEYVQYLEGKKEGGDLTITKEHSPEIRPEVNDMQEGQVKGTSEVVSEPTSNYDQWTGILKFIEIAQQEGKELAKKGVVRKEIDPDYIWNKWEE